MQVGIGYDVHRLVEGRKLILGGVEIPFAKGLLGHSDGDALLHAICDALLGASGKGDIGNHFPDDDPQYKDISSLILLEKTFKILKEDGFVVNNVDATIIAEEPRLAPYLERMKENIADCLRIKGSQINIKATTTEGLGLAGRKEGIIAQAVVTLGRKD